MQRYEQRSSIKHASSARVFLSPATRFFRLICHPKILVIADGLRTTTDTDLNFIVTSRYFPQLGISNHRIAALDMKSELDFSLGAIFKINKLALFDKE